MHPQLQVWPCPVEQDGKEEEEDKRVVEDQIDEVDYKSIPRPDMTESHFLSSSTFCTATKTATNH